MENPDNNRAEMIHRVTGLTMHTMRLHHMIVEKRIEGLCGGIHHSQHRMLMSLAKMGRTASQKDIALAMNITPACVTRTLKSLSQSGLVERDEAARDGRRNEVCLTEEGAQIVAESRELFQKLDQEMYKGFSDEDIRQLTGLIERLNRNLSGMYAPDGSED